MTSEYTSLERALEVSYTMLAEAREGRWDRLPRLEVERQPLLRAEYPRDARSRDLLQQLLACNEEMLALAARARAGGQRPAPAIPRRPGAAHLCRRGRLRAGGFFGLRAGRGWLVENPV